MKKKLTAMLLIMSMVCTFLPVSAMAASVQDCQGGEACKHEAAIGTTHYDTLQEAIDAAQDGETVKLLKSIKPTVASQVDDRYVINIEKGIILDGQGNIIDCSGSERGIRIAGAKNEANQFKVVLKNLTATNNRGACHCIGTRGGYVDLTLDNVTIDVTKATGNAQAFTIGGSHSQNMPVTIKNSTITTNNAGYGIIVFNPVNLTIDDSDITGYAALYMKDVNGSKGSAGSQVDVTNGSVLTGNNPHNAGSSSSFATIAVDAPRIVINIEDSKVVSNATGGEEQYAVSFLTPAVEGSQVTITGNSFVELKGELAFFKDVIADTTITGGTFVKNSAPLDVSEYLNANLTQNADGTIVPMDATNAEAAIGNTYYNTLNAAVKAAKTNDIIILCKDIITPNRVTIDKDLTLDFAGKTLKTEGEHSIVVSANKKLNVDHGVILNNTENKFGIAAMTGSNVTIGSDMVVDTKYSSILVSNGKETDGFVTLNVQGTLNTENIAIQGQGQKNNVTIDGATIHSNYFGVYQNGSSGGNTYNIKNTTIVDKDGTGVYISNSKGNAENINQGYQTLNIENCNITGNTAVETKYTNVTVKGDTTLTATGNPVDLIPNNNGATAEGYALAITHNAKATDKDNAAGNIIIENGNFNGYVGIQEPSEGYTTVATMTINGGYFTNDISDYVANSKAAVGSDKSGYTWMVKDAVPTDVEPAVGEPTVDVSAIPEAEQQTVQNVVKSVEADGLDAYASTEAEKVTDEQQATAAKALKDAVQGVSDDDIHIYSQAYLAIEATSYDATNKTLTLDIIPMVRVVASTADHAEDITLEGNNKNAVVLANSDKEMTVSGRVEMSITLPNGFANSKVYVQHKGYEYEATVQNNKATFINPHGFSTFTFSKNPQAVATIGSQSYTDLEAALKDAKDGQTITLLQDGLSAAMSGDSRTIHFVGADNTVKTVTVNGQTVNVPGDYTYTTSTGGGVVTRYDVTLADTDNGSITATHKRASKNSTVTITATPAEGYVVDAVTVTDKDGDKVAVTKKDDNKYTFKMPASDVTVKATFKATQTEPEQPSGLPFTDVAKDAWYFPAVEYVFNNGLMNGTTATTFAPNVELNRAMMAAVLYNMEGKPACDKSGLFSDVENGKWYTDAVNWAAANNIVSGMPDGTYAPNQALTREQMASVLYRYAEYKGIDVSSRADLGKFTDGTTVSPWAQDVVQWAVAEKLMSGNGNALQPKGTASRAQVATVLMNYCENVAK